MECHYCKKNATWMAEFSFVNDCKQVVMGDRRLCDRHADLVKRVRDRKKYRIKLRELPPASIKS